MGLLVLEREPLILIGYLGCRRRDKSSSSFLNCIDWQPVSSHPLWNPPLPTPFLPTVHLSVKVHIFYRWSIEIAGKPEALPPPALWLDRCDKKGRLLTWKPAMLSWHPPHHIVFPNQWAGVKNSLVGRCHVLFLWSLETCGRSGCASLNSFNWLTEVNDGCKQPMRGLLRRAAEPTARLVPPF